MPTDLLRRFSFHDYYYSARIRQIFPSALIDNSRDLVIGRVAADGLSMCMCVHADEATSHRLIMFAATIDAVPVTLLRDETRRRKSPLIIPPTSRAQNIAHARSNQVSEMSFRGDLTGLIDRSFCLIITSAPPRPSAGATLRRICFDERDLTQIASPPSEIDYGVGAPRR